MKNCLMAGLTLLVLSGPWLAAEAAPLGEVFKRVNKSVVIVLTEEKMLEPDKGRGSRVAVQGLASGVLISPEGKVLTAAHVVQAAHRVAVEFISGDEIGRAHV